MNRRQFRDALVQLIYLNSMNGDFDPVTYDKEVLSRLDDVLNHLEEIDEVIESHLENWTIDRLNFVDQAIVRYAVYEMKFTETPKEIVMNEAIDLTKKYSNLEDNKQRNFNNRLLENIAKTVYHE